MEHWEQVIELDELIKRNDVELGRGKVISSIDLENFPGINPVYSSSSKHNGLFGKYEKYDFEEELITWSVDGGGYFFYRPQHKYSITNVSGFLRILNQKDFDYRFLFYLFVYQHSKLKFNYVDKAHPSVIRKQYWIPTIPKFEQSRIAQILSKADAAIAQTEALIAKYQRIKTGLMQDLLTKGIDEHGNIRSEQTHRFKTEKGLRVPEDWEVDCLSTLIKAVDAHPSHRTPPTVENGVPYLGISDIDEYGNIDLKKCRKISLSVLEEHNNRYQLRDGDIIFGKIGTIGEPKRLKAWSNVTISANVILIQPNNTPEFIFWVLNSELIQTQVKNTIHSTTQPAFGMEKIRSLIIKIPPQPERAKIGHILSKAENNLISTRIHLHKLQCLKTGLMQDLLSGKVRVKIKEEAHA